VEVLVVDNASTDGSPDVARRLGARVIALERNIGFAAANNRALALAGGRFFVLVNPDAFPDPGSIDALISRLDTSPQVGIVGGVLRYASGAHQPSAGQFPSLHGGLWVALGLHRAPVLARLGIGFMAHPALCRRPRRVDWVTGAFCAARPEVGLLPETSFMYGEDVEWAQETARRGLEVWLEPRATAVHLLGESAGARSPTLKQKHRVVFELRWFSRRGRAAVQAARAIMVLHALVRLAAVIALRPTGRATFHDEEPWRALIRAALREPGATHADAG
jgi:GT2 family glycosyltransferase